MKFNQKSFEENDEKGKGLLKNFLISKGHEIIENENIYGIDFFSKRNNKDYYWEVEMKPNRPWTSREDFHFDSVSFLSRKSKWVDTPFWYVIICSETNAAVFCKSDIVFNKKYKQKIRINTAERYGLDNFYRVPKELCIFVPPNEFKV